MDNKGVLLRRACHETEQETSSAACAGRHKPDFLALPELVYAATIEFCSSADARRLSLTCQRLLEVCTARVSAITLRVSGVDTYGTPSRTHTPTDTRTHTDTLASMLSRRTALRRLNVGPLAEGWTHAPFILSTLSCALTHHHHHHHHYSSSGSPCRRLTELHIHTDLSPPTLTHLSAALAASALPQLQRLCLKPECTHTPPLDPLCDALTARACPLLRVLSVTCTRRDLRLLAGALNARAADGRCRLLTSVSVFTEQETGLGDQDQDSDGRDDDRSGHVEAGAEGDGGKGDPQAYGALVGSKAMAHVETMALGNVVSGSEVDAVGAGLMALLPQKLRTLEICGLWYRDNPVSITGLARAVSQGAAPQLKSLSVRRCAVDAAAADELAEAVIGGRVERLQLCQVQISEDSMARLVNAVTKAQACSAGRRL